MEFFKKDETFKKQLAPLEKKKAKTSQKNSQKTNHKVSHKTKKQSKKSINIKKFETLYSLRNMKNHA